MKMCAVVLAAGSGTRMKSTIPKQFMTINGKPLIEYTLEKLSNNKHISGIIVVCNEDYINHMDEIIKKYQIKKIIDVIKGGNTGIESTY